MHPLYEFGGFTINHMKFKYINTYHAYHLLYVTYADEISYSMPIKFGNLFIVKCNAMPNVNKVVHMM